MKRVAHAAAALLVLPAAVVCWIEARVAPASELVFASCAQALALLPGPVGTWMRTAFYRLTLERCARDWSIGFGSVFTHRCARVGEGVYIGTYAMIGSAHLGPRCLIGSRASLLSGGDAHELDDSGNWTPFDLSRAIPIEIGAGAWIGEGAIVKAAVGAGAMIACGAVVASTVPANVMVGGNPARFVRIVARRGDDGSAARSRP